MAVRRIDKATLGKLQNSEHLFSGYSRIPIQEIINCGAVLEVLEKQRSRYMSALEPPHTPRLAGSALHYRALAPVEHSRHDKPTRKEYKGGVREDMVGAPERARRGHSAKSRFVVLSGTSSESCRLVRRSFDNNRRLPVRTQRSRSCGLRDLRLGSFQMLRPHGGETSFCPATSSSSCRSLAGSTELAEVLPELLELLLLRRPVDSVYISSIRIPPNKRCRMHSVPLWIGAALYFATLFFWQSHYVSALDQAFRFPSYQSIPLDSYLN
jgi:hypothetical protein